MAWNRQVVEEANLDRDIRYDIASGAETKETQFLSRLIGGFIGKPGILINHHSDDRSGQLEPSTSREIRA